VADASKTIHLYLVFKGGTMNERNWGGAVLAAILAVLGLAYIANVAPFNFLGEWIEAAPGFILGGISAGIGWISGIIGPAFASGLASGSAVVVPVALAPIAGVVTVSIGVAVSVVAIQPVIRAAEKYRFQTISSLVGVMSYFIADSLAKAALIPSPDSEITGVMNGVLLILGGLLFRQPGAKNKVGGAVTIAVVPGYLMAELITTRSTEDIVSGMAAIGVATWLKLLLVIGTALLVAGLAVVIDDEEPSARRVAH
jgi:hypothetical protein